MDSNTTPGKHLPIFGGSAINKIDAQHRVAVPAFWRDENPSGKYVIMPGRDSTFQLLTEDVYEILYGEKLRNMNPVDPVVQKNLRILYSMTFRLTCDKQGRLQLPAKVIEQAALKDEVAFIGAGNFGQMMDGARWRKEEEEALDAGDSFLDILN